MSKKLKEYAAMDKALEVHGKMLYCRSCGREVNSSQICHVYILIEIVSNFFKMS